VCLSRLRRDSLSPLLINGYILLFCLCSDRVDGKNQASFMVYAIYFDEVRGNQGLNQDQYYSVE